MKTAVLINAGAGTVASQNALELRDRVAEICHGLALSARVEAVPSVELQRRIERAAADGSTDAVVLGGGDGTLKTAAGVLAGTRMPLGVLPLGTLNHFARDLGIPTQLEDALRTVAAGSLRSVDVAEVNGQAFLNNCSIGLYVEAVQQRERLRRYRRAAKWTAMCQGAWQALRSFPISRLRLQSPESTLWLATPQLVIGNNRYETDLFALGRRAALDRGELWLYAALDQGRFGFLRLVLRSLVGRLDQARDFLSICSDRLEVERRRPGRLIRMALDGEVAAMPSPLRFRIRPKALGVLAPPAVA